MRPFVSDSLYISGCIILTTVDVRKRVWWSTVYAETDAQVASVGRAYAAFCVGLSL